MVDLRLPPGPSQLPVIGSLHHLVGALPHRALRDLSLCHGPLMLLKLGAKPVIVASSAEAAKEIMKTHDATFCTRPLNSSVKALSEDGMGIVFAPYGDHWRQMRKICFLELLSAKRVSSFGAIREEGTARFIRSISAASESDQPLVNVSEMLAAYVADTAVHTIMGGQFTEHDALFRHVEEAVRLSGGFTLPDLFPSSRLARALSITRRKAEVFRGVFLGFMGRAIDEHLENSRTALSEEAHEEDLIDVLLRVQGEGKLQFPLTMNDIKAVIFDLLAAGTETTSTTLQWAMAELMRNPSVMSRAQDEVRTAFRGKNKVTKEGLERSSENGKLQTGPLDPDVEDDPDAAGGAPPPLCPSMAWFRPSPSADGKSPVAGSREPTPRTTIFIARINIRSSFLFNELRLDRHADAGEGVTSSTDPKSCELGEDEASTAELRRAPPPERTGLVPKRRADSAASSSAPPASNLDDPTLYTGRGSTIPHPPAAGAAAGGQGIGDPTACEVDLRAVFKESLLPTVAGEGNDQAAYVCNVLKKGTTVIVNGWAISRDPECWDEPEAFAPERFLGSDRDFKGGSFEFIPFGAGRRICPGILFGLATVELALASLLFHFDWSLPDGVRPSELDMTETMGLTYRKKVDLWLRPTPHVYLSC